MKTLTKREKQMRPFVTCLILFVFGVLIFSGLFLKKVVPQAKDEVAPAKTAHHTNSVPAALAFVDSKKTDALKLQFELDLNTLAKVPVRTNRTENFGQK